jgi:prepilin-type N-terminal cleavage/methylation domain-containing protein
MMRQKGFSIIEVVISLFILGIIIIVYAASANTVTINQRARNKQLAVRIAVSEIESLRSTPYTSFPSSYNITNTMLANLPHGAMGTVTISDYNDMTKQIVASVTWTDPGKTASSNYSLTTLVTQGGLGQ